MPPPASQTCQQRRPPEPRQASVSTGIKTHTYFNFPTIIYIFCFVTGSTPAPTSLYNASSTFRAASPYDQLCNELLTGSLEETAAGGAAAAGHSSSAVGNLTGLAIACNATVFNGRTSKNVLFADLTPLFHTPCAHKDRHLCN